MLTAVMCRRPAIGELHYRYYSDCLLSYGREDLLSVDVRINMRHIDVLRMKRLFWNLSSVFTKSIMNAPGTSIRAEKARSSSRSLYILTFFVNYCLDRQRTTKNPTFNIHNLLSRVTYSTVLIMASTCENACHNPKQLSPTKVRLRLGSQQLTEARQRNMAAKSLGDLLKIEKPDTLCALPPQSTLLEKDSRYHATRICVPPREYEQFPVLKLDDFNEMQRPSRSKIYDLNKHKLWIPLQDDTMDEHGQVVKSKLTQAHIDHKTVYDYRERHNLLPKPHDDWELSWTRGLMVGRLKEEFSKCMNQSIAREKKSPDTTSATITNEMVDTPASSQASPVSDVTVERFEAAEALLALAAQPCEFSNDEFNERLNAEMASQGHKSSQPIENDQAVSLIERFERAIARRINHFDYTVELPESNARAEPLNNQFVPHGGFQPLVTECKAQGLKPFRRIARNEEDAKRPPTERPAWASKNGQTNEEIREYQRHLMIVAIRQKNVSEDQPIDKGLDQVDKLLAPLYKAEAAEEYEHLTASPNPLTKIFDEPDRPIGVFDRAEVDHDLEKERQLELKKWRKRGYKGQEIEDLQRGFFGMGSAELDNRAKNAQQTLITSRRLLPASAPKQQSASPKKRKRDTIDNENGVEENALENVRRSKRTRKVELLNEDDSEDEVESIERLHQELEELSQASLRDSAIMSRQNSGSPSVTGPRITWKLFGEIIRITQSRPPSPHGETTEEEEDQPEEMEID